ncbi:MAG: DUF932 domain-containing protein [Thermodesulfobacteriota bacterium]|nr:MAG: DUF932 domain-containing protein [Thermodesulfobacteriota bacterium]
MDLVELLQTLEKQHPLKWDRKLNTSVIDMKVEDGSAKLEIPGNYNLLAITKPCHQQIAERLDIPVKYYNRMEAEAPYLLAGNVNAWLTRMEKDIFVRGLGDAVRAFLSNRYRVIDHLDFLYCSLNELQANRAEIEDCHLSETEMYVKVRSHHLKDVIRHRDDLIIGGLLLTNSETGHKALRVEPRIFRVQCTNGMVIEKLTTRQVHLGNGNGGNGELDDDMVYLAIRRSIRELFGRFGEIVQSLRDSTEIKILNPQGVINNLVKHYGLNETQKENILMAFGSEPESDAYGIANAVTNAAQKEESWEGSLELEKIGGRLLALPAQGFKAFDC